MHEKFINYFSKISPLSKQESETVVENMQTKTLKRGDHLLKEGEISANTYFVLEG